MALHSFAKGSLAQVDKSLVAIQGLDDPTSNTVRESFQKEQGQLRKVVFQAKPVVAQVRS